MRAHTIARLEIKQDSIQMAFLSASWLKAKIQEKSVDTPYVKADDALLLTGTTEEVDRKSTRLNSSHTVISYAVFCLKKKKQNGNKDLLWRSETPPTSFHVEYNDRICRTKST